jgi:aspartate aminotransferase-like enzyme
MGLEVFSQPDAHSVTVVAMRVPPGVDTSAVRRMMREKYDIVIGGGQQELAGKILRIGTMGDISEADVIRAITALDETLRELGAEISSKAAVRAAEELLTQSPA